MKRILTLLVLLTLFSCNTVRNDYGIVTNFSSNGQDGICRYRVRFDVKSRGSGEPEHMDFSWPCGEYAVGDTLKLK